MNAVIAEQRLNREEREINAIEKIYQKIALLCYLYLHLLYFYFFMHILYFLLFFFNYHPALKRFKIQIRINKIKYISTQLRQYLFKAISFVFSLWSHFALGFL